MYFYPRPPRGGRRLLHGLCSLVFQISIHALREEGDVMALLWAFQKLYFYPRPPRGGRPIWQAYQGRSTGFLSTPSARRATSGRRADRGHQRISIHALREEGDMLVSCLLPAGVVFLSTPSARRATWQLSTLSISQ